jgi:hypothetical protein
MSRLEVAAWAVVVVICLAWSLAGGLLLGATLLELADSGASSVGGLALAGTVVIIVGIPIVLGAALSALVRRGPPKTIQAVAFGVLLWFGTIVGMYLFLSP